MISILLFSILLLLISSSLLLHAQPTTTTTTTTTSPSFQVAFDFNNIVHFKPPYGSEWLLICNEYSTSYDTAMQLCKFAGYEKVYSVAQSSSTWIRSDYTNKFGMQNVNCPSTATSLKDCTYIPVNSCSGNYNTLLVKCIGKQGPNFNYLPLPARSVVPVVTGYQWAVDTNSLLHVKVPGSNLWQMVCDDGLNEVTVTAFCRFIGMETVSGVDWGTASSSVVASSPYSRNGFGLDDVYCSVAATKMEDCRKRAAGHDCSISYESTRISCRGVQGANYTILGYQNSTRASTRAPPYSYEPIITRPPNFNAADSSWEFFLDSNNIVHARRRNSGDRPNWVCDDGIGRQTAASLCFFIGFETLENVSFSSASGSTLSYGNRFVLDNVYCPSNATSFKDCSYNTNHNCNGMYERLVLRCTGTIGSNGINRLSGVYYRGSGAGKVASFVVVVGVIVLSLLM